MPIPTSREARERQDDAARQLQRELRRPVLDAERVEQLQRDLPPRRTIECVGCAGTRGARLIEQTLQVAHDGARPNSTVRYTPALCPGCIAFRHEGDLQETIRQQQQADAIRRKLDALGTPLDYADCGVDDFDPTQRGAAPADAREVLTHKQRLARRYVAVWPRRLAMEAFPRLAIFTGVPGSGKTRLAYSIAHDVIRQHDATAIVMTLGDIVRDLREAWRAKSGASERERLRRYRDVDLLVIDEVSPDAMYGEPVQHLYDLIAPREANRAPTILTTNAADVAFTTMIRPALTSRAALGGMWEFGTSDYRAIRARDDDFDAEVA